MIRFYIITPSLNQLAHLQRCVASIRDQEGAGAVVEQWVVDGGSADGTVEWLRAEGIPFVSEPDRGMYDALNKGLAHVRSQSASDTDVWAWLNADEQYLPGTLQRVAEIMVGEPEIDVLCGGALLVNESGDLLTYWKSMPLRRWYLEAGVLYNLSCASFFRARVLSCGIRFDSSRKAASDLLFMKQLLKQGVRTRCVPDYWATYTFAASNISNQSDARSEHRAAQHGRYWWSRPHVLLIRIVKAVERWVRGTRRERFPLTYAIYTNTDAQRTVFTAPRASARWPHLKQQ